MSDKHWQEAVQRQSSLCGHAGLSWIAFYNLWTCSNCELIVLCVHDWVWPAFAQCILGYGDYCMDLNNMTLRYIKGYFWFITPRGFSFMFLFLFSVIISSPSSNIALVKGSAWSEIMVTLLHQSLHPVLLLFINFNSYSQFVILSISYKQIKGFVKVVLVFTGIVFSIIQCTLTG